MQKETVNKYLLIFTIVVASIALLLTILIFLKDKFCPRKSIYTKQPYMNAIKQQNEMSQIMHDSMDKLLSRQDGTVPVDIIDLDYIDERSIHLVPSTIVVHSLKIPPSLHSGL